MILSFSSIIWTNPLLVFAGIPASNMIIELDKNPVFKSEKIVEFYTQPQPSFNKQFDLLMNNLNDNFQNGIKNYLFSANENQAKRFKEIFKDRPAQFDLSAYPTGMYLIRYPIGTKWITGKIILQRY